MEETAKVVRLINDEMAEVELRRHSACSKCGKCGHGADDAKDARFEVGNPISAQPGDFVILTMETRNLLMAVFLVYLLPLITLLIGYGVGHLINTQFDLWAGEGMAILTGLIFMAITFLGVRRFDRKLGYRSSFRPQIKRVL